MRVPRIDFGCLVREIVGMDNLAADPERKQLLYAQTSAVAVDMESHIAAAIAAAHQIPFAASRVIIDPADSSLSWDRTSLVESRRIGGLRGTPETEVPWPQH